MTDQNAAAAQAPAIPLPGTPEYEELYRAAMAELEAADQPPAAAPAAPAGPPAAEPPAAAPAAAAPAAEPPAAPPGEPIPAAFTPEAQGVIDRLTSDLEQQGKRLHDTQAWTHGIVDRLRTFYKDVRHAQSQGERPKALEDIDGLEEAIQHVVKGTIGPEDELFPELAGQPPGGTPSALDYTDDQWTGIVATALPDMDELLKDEGLLAQVNAAKTDMGEDWKNPLLAINAMAELRSDFLHSQRVDAAVKSAIERHQTRTTRASNMELPGGAAGSGAPPPPGGKTPGVTDPVQDAGYWDDKNMTPEKFEQERQRVLSQ